METIYLISVRFYEMDDSINEIKIMDKAILLFDFYMTFLIMKLESI